MRPTRPHVQSSHSRYSHRSRRNYPVAVTISYVQYTIYYADYQRINGQWDQLSKILMSLSIGHNDMARKKKNVLEQQQNEIRFIEFNVK